MAAASSSGSVILSSGSLLVSRSQEMSRLSFPVDLELVPNYVDLILVARALERIGDHATNIAEDSFWRDQAADIRHTYGPKKEC
jgi:phosphate uptake regulator